eukprot:1177000-Prorocentrum_minimum.AAC.3
MFEGAVAYHGPASEAAALFASAGLPVPAGFNPADHYLRQLAMGYLDQVRASTAPAQLSNNLSNNPAQLSKNQNKSPSSQEG